MAIDKDPSIFNDRSNIGSSDELDEYGVWVKSEPKDVSDTMETEKTSNLDPLLDESFEPSLPDIEDLPDLDMDTTSDLDMDKDTSSNGDETSFDSIENLQSFDNLPEPEDFSVEELPKVSDSVQSFEELDSFNDIDIESFEETLDQPKKTEPTETKKNINVDEFTELSMNDFLDTEELEGEKIFDLDQSVEESPLDIDLEFNESVDLNMMSSESAMDIGTVSEAKDSDLNLETVSDFDDFLSDLEEKSETEAETEESVNLQPNEESLDFDDVEAVHKELEESSFESEPAEKPIAAVKEEQGRVNVDLSTQLLMRIADELSSIKSELSTLKEELAVYKKVAPPAATEESSQEAKGTGFFDDEEDEKIALTGDELDNILNTAEFTEESGTVVTDVEETPLLETPKSEIETEIEQEQNLKQEGQEELKATISEESLQGSFQLDEMDFLSDKEDILSEDEEIESIETQPPVEDVVELSVDEDLALLQEEGVLPITEAPEDTSYLEEELLTQQRGEAADLDLSEAVIDEPDLSGIVLEENPLEEPSIEDIHIDLETEEVLHIEGQDELNTEREEPADMEILTENEPIELDESSTEALPVSNMFETESETSPDFEDLENLEEISAPVQEESFEDVLPEGFVVEPEAGEPIELFNEGAKEEILEEIPEEELPTEIEEHVPPVKEESSVSPDLTQEIKAVLSYMDQLLESLPEDKIEEFAKSEYFDTYKKLFEELGLA